MPRTKCKRYIDSHPEVIFFKPAGIPMSKLEEVILHVDEYEAIRLCDWEGMYQDEAAEQMQVSRATIGRILTEAHRKIAGALIDGKAIRIQGGAFEIKEGE